MSSEIKDVRLLPMGRLYILADGTGVDSGSVNGNPVKGQSIAKGPDGRWDIANGALEACEV